jgi:hypothetical protein
MSKNNFIGCGPMNLFLNIATLALLSLIGAYMNRIKANEFASNWINAWNRKDVNAVLEHYADDAKFISPKAEILSEVHL